MLTEENLERARKELARIVENDMHRLDELRVLIRKHGRPSRIQARSATSISFVGTDGGHNVTGVNPFLAQLMRVVDSNNHEYWLEVVSSSTKLHDLDELHAKSDSPLDRLMNALGLNSLAKVARVFHQQTDELPPSWIQVYRHITEWAVLYSLLEERFASDTLIVWDGPLRTKVFAPGVFKKLVELIDAQIRRHYQERRRRIYIAGVTKNSKVLEKFRLAVGLEGTMRQSFPCYLELSGELINKAIEWDEYLSDRERQSAAAARAEASGSADIRAVKHDKYSAGQMYFVKFGARPSDPIWAADIWESQAGDAQAIFGYLLNDAVAGFPVPMFPMCLQKAYSNAALVDFDMDLFHHSLRDALRTALGDGKPILDRLALQVNDPASQRYK